MPENAPAGNASGVGSTRTRRNPEAWGVLLLGVLVVLVLARTQDVRELVDQAVESRIAIASSDDFYRAMPVLGPEFPIFARLRREFAIGTPVSVPVDASAPVDILARSQRFWLALLPDYPVSGDAALVICPRPCAEPGDSVVETGRHFELIERSGAGLRR